MFVSVDENQVFRKGWFCSFAVGSTSFSQVSFIVIIFTDLPDIFSQHSRFLAVDSCKTKNITPNFFTFA